MRDVRVNNWVWSKQETRNSILTDMKDFFNKCRPYDFATHFFDWRQSVILARETRGQKRRLRPGGLILGASDSCACVYFDLLARFSCAKITDRLHACMPVLHRKMNCDQSNEISGLSLRYCWRLIAKLRRSPTLKSENKLFSSCNLSFLRSPAIYLFNWTTVINDCPFRRF